MKQFQEEIRQVELNQNRTKHLKSNTRLTQADNIYCFIMQNFCDMVSMNKIVISYDAINRLQFSGMTGYHEKSFSGF